MLDAHSWACDLALRFAAEHPERISGLVLVSPAFLQAPGPRFTRSRLTAPKLFRRMSAARLAAALGLPEGPEVNSAAADLRRSGVARRVVTALRSAHAAREASGTLLDRVSVPVEIVVGSADPLVATVDRQVTEIAGSGHYPQLTHPAEVARHLGAPSARSRG